MAEGGEEKDLDERCQAVGGARSVRHDVCVGVKVTIVDSDDVSWDVRALGWGGDEDLLGTSLDVLACTFPVQEDSSSLDDQIDLLQQHSSSQGCLLLNSTLYCMIRHLRAQGCQQAP